MTNPPEAPDPAGSPKRTPPPSARGAVVLDDHGYALLALGAPEPAP